MRCLTPLMLVAAVGCGSKSIEDPFANSTDPMTTNPGTDPTDASASSGDAESTGSSTDDPTNATEATDPATTVDPDSGTSDGGPAVCGDGIISGEDEVCDGEEFGDLSCMSLGFMGGDLVCTAMCQSYDSSGCYNCGNNVIEGAEDCEGEVPNDVDCVSEGFTEGEISCSPVNCQYDTSLCSLCGNGIIEGDEPCDGDDLAGMDCAAIGFEMGALACNANCSYDFTGCSGGQYIQDFEVGSIPAEFGQPSAVVWIADSGNPIAGSWSAASGDIGNSQTSTITLAVTYAIAGTVAFTHEESTESNYDYLEFWIDNVLLDDWSGSNAPANASYPVAAGAHTFEWRYRKDGSLDSGSDRVWVDDIALSGGVPN